MTTNASAWSDKVVPLDAMRRRKIDVAEETNVRVGDGIAPWEQAAARRLEELIKLPYGWDGHSAPPVLFHNAAFTFSMLKSICAFDAPAPNILPGYHGDLQVEWRSRTMEIRLHVLAANRVQAYISAPDRLGEDIEQNLQADFSEITRWVAALTGHDGDDARATA